MFERMARHGAVLGIAVLLAGCLAPTPFRPASRGGDGYTVERTAPDHFRIGFAGNAATSARQVQDALAYLAARVTLRNGADYYVVANETQGRRMVYDPLGSRTGYPEGQIPCCGPSRGMTSAEHEAGADIVIRKGTAPPDDPAAHDARRVLEAVGPRIRRGGGFSVY